MKHTNVIAIVRGFQAGVLCVVVGTMLGVPWPIQNQDRTNLGELLQPRQILKGWLTVYCSDRFGSSMRRSPNPTDRAPTCSDN